jgi:para-nitrobenzyl esterase
MAEENSESSAMLSRREMLAGACVAGGAIAALALPTGSASAQQTPPSGKGTETNAPNYSPPVVEVTGGRLRGFVDGKTTTFLGIPYAEAERFELPKPVKPWSGIKDAQAWGPICPIPNMTKPGVDEFVFPHRYWLQNEHCQVLNIWTPGLSGTAKRPVMFWIHGGGFTDGSSMESYAYDGKNLSEFGDVVVVSLNHRLNIIGTLDLSAYGAQYANSRYTGSADIVAALQWVHENIATFGGDPGNVTVFGQSGGGSKVSRLLHTPSAKGLLHKAITESGGGGNYADLDVAKRIKTQQMITAATLENLKLTGADIDKLKAVPYVELLAAGDAALKSVGKQVGENLVWDVYPDDRYILRDYADWTADVPLLAGAVFSEHIGTLHKGTGKNDWTDKEVDEHLTAAYGDKKSEVVAEFRKVFPRKKVQDVIYFAAASRAGSPAALTRKLAKARAPAYNYLFAYEYPVDGGITAFHTCEIAFVFHNLTEPHVRVATGGTPAGLALQDKVSRAWINFARTGNPSQPGLTWKPFTPADPQAMLFDVVSECRNLGDTKLVAMLASQGART